jgi:hypothetical protein
MSDSIKPSARDGQVLERKCVDCAALAPESASEYTLISARYGWRVTRATRQDGRGILEWRCRKCFTAFREKQFLS